MKRRFAVAMLAAIFMLPVRSFAQDAGEPLERGAAAGSAGWIFLTGRWDLYGTDLQDDHNWRGYIAVNKHGDIVKGEFNSPEPDTQHEGQHPITGGHLDFDLKTGKVTGTFSDSDGVTTTVDATMNYYRDQISGVINAIGGDEEGILILVKTKGQSAFSVGR